MRELIIVRHGEADHMVKNLTGGYSNSQLTQLGKRQALLTGQRLACLIGNRQFQFFTSDLARAAETADIIAEHLAVRPAYAAGLRELNNGAAADLTHEDAAKIAIPISDPVIDWEPYPGAESWRTMCNRVFAFLDSLDRTKDITLLVLHANSGNAAICWWLGLCIGTNNIAFDLEPCSINHFAVNHWDEKNILKLNDTAHLVPLICTNEDFT
jgi:broad specificity phosphatase PhoE